VIAIINYGLGNLHSVRKAVEYVGGQSIVTDDPTKIAEASKIILPGVGAFGEGMHGLEERGLIAPLKIAAAAGKPFLGICLGMQLLFEESEEKGLHSGLGLIPGKVLSFEEPGVKIPQIGWNQLDQQRTSHLLAGVENGAYVYFNHSYYCLPYERETVLASTDYGLQFASVVHAENVYGVQFHPEKSQRIGLKILGNFVGS
jgi:glutamine amidotransferase